MQENMEAKQDGGAKGTAQGRKAWAVRFGTEGSLTILARTPEEAQVLATRAIDDLLAWGHITMAIKWPEEVRQ